MGLDNMPHKYPCKDQGTAVIEVIERDYGNGLEKSGQIDCDATMEKGGCPYVNDDNRPDDGGVLGLFGTPCWYRGKYGNYLVEVLKGEEEPDSWTADPSFYAEGETDFKTPEECRELADFMEEKLLDYDGKKVRAKNDDNEDEDLTSEILYAIWYLRWSDHECGGLDAWY